MTGTPDGIWQKSEKHLIKKIEQNRRNGWPGGCRKAVNLYKNNLTRWLNRSILSNQRVFTLDYRENWVLIYQKTLAGYKEKKAMQEIFSNTVLTVNQLIEKIDTGELGLPELQRPFIWKDAKVRDLFDSMIRGYPIGYLMLWECPELDKKKSIGVDSHSYNSPKEVIIDGQQRLTSLYAVIKGKKVMNSKFEEKSIVISYCLLQNKFEVGYSATEKDPEWIYNINGLFAANNAFQYTVDFFQRLREHRASKGGELTSKEQGIIANHINAVANLKSHTLPVFDIKSNAEEEDVSEIFVRVNSGGVSLKQNDFILTLLSLYWDDGRREIEQFSRESTCPARGRITSYNRITTVSAQDVVRVVMAYAFGRARLKYGYKLLRGADFDRRGTVDDKLRVQRFETLKAKLPDVLDVHSWHEFFKAIINAGYLSDCQTQISCVLQRKYAPDITVVLLCLSDFFIYGFF